MSSQISLCPISEAMSPPPPPPPPLLTHLCSAARAAAHPAGEWKLKSLLLSLEQNVAIVPDRHFRSFARLRVVDRDAAPHEPSSHQFTLSSANSGMDSAEGERGI